jgi:N-carbamoyl-L-amino-acid hydrolase
MDPAWIDKLRAAAGDLGLPGEAIPRAAGHNAAVFANVGIPSAMIFIRNENGSHNPHEDMKIDDFISAVAVMRKVLAEAAL